MHMQFRSHMHTSMYRYTWCWIAAKQASVPMDPAITRARGMRQDLHVQILQKLYFRRKTLLLMMQLLRSHPWWLEKKYCFQPKRRLVKLTCSKTADFLHSSSFSRSTLSADAFKSACFCFNVSSCDLNSWFSSRTADFPCALLLTWSSTIFARAYSFRKKSSDGCSHEDNPFSSW